MHVNKNEGCWRRNGLVLEWPAGLIGDLAVDHFSACKGRNGAFPEYVTAELLPLFGVAFPEMS